MNRERGREKEKEKQEIKMENIRKESKKPG